MRIVLCILLFSLLGCDTPGMIELKNKTESNAIYRYIEKSETGKEDTITIEIPSRKTKDVLFGFGQVWTDKRIKEYLSHTSSIELITVRDTLTLTDKKQMYNYFKKRRRGLFKNEIKVIIK